MPSMEFDIVRDVAARLDITEGARNLAFSGSEPALDSPHRIALAANARRGPGPRV